MSASQTTHPRTSNLALDDKKKKKKTLQPIHTKVPNGHFLLLSSCVFSLSLLAI